MKTLEKIEILEKLVIGNRSEAQQKQIIENMDNGWADKISDIIETFEVKQNDELFIL